MLRLFIGNIEAELDQDTNIVLSMQYEDISNPTLIKNSFSKTVSLPATAQNNALFDSLYNESHEIHRYDPSKRTDFHLLRDGDLIDTGYMYVSKVIYSGRYPRSYEIQLRGNLGNFLLDLSEEGKTLENLNFAPSLFNHTIDRNAVVNSWTNEYYRYILSYSGLYDNFDSDKVFNTFDSDLISKYHIAAGNERAIIPFSGGFIKVVGTEVSLYQNVPNFITDDIRGITFDPLTNNFVVFTYTEICYGPADNEEDWIRVNPGLDGTESGFILDFSIIPTAEYYSVPYSFITTKGRYYYSSQLDRNYTPYEFTSNEFTGTRASISRVARRNGNMEQTLIYVAITYGVNIYYLIHGFNVIKLDPPYTSPNNLDIQNSAVPLHGNYTYSNLYFTACINTAIIDALETFPSESTNLSWKVILNAPSQGAFVNVSFIEQTQLYLFYGQNKVLYSAVPITGALRWVINDLTNNDLPDNCNILNIVYQNGIYTAIIFDNSDSSFKLAFSTNLLNWTVNAGYYSDDTEESNENQRDEYRSYYQRPSLRLKYLFEQILKDSGWSYTLFPEFFNENNPFWEKVWIIQSRLKYIEEPPLDHADNVRSGDQVTYQILVKNGISQRDFLLSYMKAFGLYMKIDKAEKHVNIMTRNEYFADYEILEWTGKVDFNGTLQIKPLPVDYMYGIFKWQNAGSHYEQEHKNEFAREYGQFRYDTQYRINSDSKEYLSDNIFYNLVMATRHDTRFEGRDPNDKFADNKVLPAMFTLSNGQLNYNDSSMHLCFIDGMTELSQPIRITDDNPDMLQLGLFMWNDSPADTLTVSSIPNVHRTISQEETLTSPIQSSHQLIVFDNNGTVIHKS